MIEFSHVYKTFDGTAQVLSGIGLQVEKGEFVFLTGPSGAGKTTLFNLLAGYDKPTSGRIRVAGIDLGQTSATEISYYRRRIGVIYQDFRLLKDRTVFENVALPLLIRGERSAVIEKRVRDILSEVSLNFKKDAFPSQLSGGEQQRVAIARALVHQPGLLIADEPTGNLDPNLTEEIMNVLTRVNAQGTTVFVATHDLAMVRRRAKRVVELRSGRVVGAQ